MDLADVSSLADLYRHVRNQRLEADRLAADLRAEETKLHDTIVNYLLQEGATAVGGKHIVLNLKSDIRFIAEDWNKIYAYMKENDAFDVMEKRLLQTGLKARLDDGIIVPGVGKMNKFKLTISEPKS
jgi:hypothetical protein